MTYFWVGFGFTFFGMTLGYILCVQQLKNEIDNKQIDIKRAKMKKNENSTQEFTSNLSGDPEQHKNRKLKIFKRKKNEE